MATRTLFATAAVALAAAALAPSAHAQSLVGSQVTAAGYCCSAPTPADQATNAATATVGAATEFPEGSFTSLSSGLSTLPVAIDVGSNYIRLVYSAGGLANAGGFNGYVFTFDNAPTITRATLDPSSNYDPTVSFAGNRIFLNEAGLTLSPGSTAMIDLTTCTPAPPVPEPATYAMLLGGLGVLGWTARQRRG